MELKPARLHQQPDRSDLQVGLSAQKLIPSVPKLAAEDC